MSEINNNGFGNKINDIRFRNIQPDKQDKTKPENTSDKKAEEKNIVPDTGILGRSQVKGIKGGDLTKSIDETVALAIKHPEIISGGDEIFDLIYDRFIKEGYTPDKAYALASLGVEEFTEISKAQKQ
jgi:hypothetical protein